MFECLLSGKTIKQALTDKGRSEHGIGLIEILLVMSILGILLGLVVTGFSSYHSKAENKKAQSNLLTAHGVLTASYERGYSFNKSNPGVEATRIKSKTKELDITLDIGELRSLDDSKSSLIYLELLSKDDAVLCNRAPTMALYCIRVNYNGIRVRVDTDPRNDLWTVELRTVDRQLIDNNQPDAYDRILDDNDGKVSMPDQVWNGKSSPDGQLNFTKEYVVPTVRLECDLNKGTDLACPEISTPNPTARFSWLLSENMAAPTVIECQLDGRQLDSNEPGWTECANPSNIITLTTQQLSKDPTTYDSLSQKDKLLSTLGNHTFTIRVKNDAGESVSDYSWTIIPELPIIKFNKINPSSLTACDDWDDTPVASCHPPVNTPFETTSRTMELEWEALIDPVTSPTGSLIEVYCKLQLAKWDGTYHTVWGNGHSCYDQDNPNGSGTLTQVNDQHWKGTLSFPSDLSLYDATQIPPFQNNSTLPYNNLVPHLLTVTAVNQAGASSSQSFSWRVVDHSNPSLVEIPNSVTAASGSTFVLRSHVIEPPGSAFGPRSVCYSTGALAPHQWANPLRQGSRGDRYTVRVSAYDQNSGVDPGFYRMRWPELSPSAMGNNGNRSQHIIGPNLRNNVVYAYTYQVGNGVSMNSNSPTTWYVDTEIGAPPTGSVIGAPDLRYQFTLVPDITPPGIPLYTAPVMNSHGWTNESVVTISNIRTTTPGAGCGNIDAVQYRYRRNGGDWIGPIGNNADTGAQTKAAQDNITVTGLGAVNQNNGGSGSISISGTQSQGDGIWEFQVRSTDDVNNASAWSSTITIRRDTVAPQVPVTNVNGIVDANQTTQGEAQNNRQAWTRQERTVYPSGGTDTNGALTATYVSGLGAYECNHLEGNSVSKFNCPQEASPFNLGDNEGGGESVSGRKLCTSAAPNNTTSGNGCRFILGNGTRGNEDGQTRYCHYAWDRAGNRSSCSHSGNGRFVRIDQVAPTAFQMRKSKNESGMEGWDNTTTQVVERTAGSNSSDPLPAGVNIQSGLKTSPYINTGQGCVTGWSNNTQNCYITAYDNAGNYRHATTLARAGASSPTGNGRLVNACTGGISGAPTAGGGNGNPNCAITIRRDTINPPATTANLINGTAVSGCTANGGASSPLQANTGDLAAWTRCNRNWTPAGNLETASTTASGHYTSQCNGHCSEANTTGQYSRSYRSQDKAGNWGAYGATTIASIDKTPPSAPSAITSLNGSTYSLPDGSNGWFTGNLYIISGGSTDSNSGVQNGSYQPSGDHCGLRTRDRVFSEANCAFMALDNAGNTSAYGSKASFKRDTGRPVVHTGYDGPISGSTPAIGNSTWNNSPAASHISAHFRDSPQTGGESFPTIPNGHSGLDIVQCYRGGWNVGENAIGEHEEIYPGYIYNNNYNDNLAWNYNQTLGCGYAASFRGMYYVQFYVQDGAGWGSLNSSGVPGYKTAGYSALDTTAPSAAYVDRGLRRGACHLNYPEDPKTYCLDETTHTTWAAYIEYAVSDPADGTIPQNSQAALRSFSVRSTGAGDNLGSVWNTNVTHITSSDGYVQLCFNSCSGLQYTIGGAWGGTMGDISDLAGNNNAVSLYTVCVPSDTWQSGGILHRYSAGYSGPWGACSP